MKVRTEIQEVVCLNHKDVLNTALTLVVFYLVERQAYVASSERLLELLQYRFEELSQFIFFLLINKISS